jgi:hypothetical protein
MHLTFALEFCSLIVRVLRSGGAMKFLLSGEIFMPDKTEFSRSRPFRWFRAVAGCIAILISTVLVPPSWADGEPASPTNATQDRFEALLSEIGGILIADKREGTKGTLLYARVNEGRVAMAIFEDRGDRVWFLDHAPSELSRVLLELWQLSPPEARWAELEYVVQDKLFSVEFAYPEDIDPGEEPADRVARIVAWHFGRKRVSHPPSSPDNAPP